MIDSNKFIAYLTLITGLLISVVAIYYSVSGLVALFAAAPIAIIVMGVVLEVGKLSATLWLKQNWSNSPSVLKFYLLVAIAGLMLITSMGIYGFLSKAHLDQAVPTSVITEKIAVIDEKIKIVEENINAYKNSISQLDNGISQAISLASTDKGALKAIAARKSQSQERSQLQNGITSAQHELESLRLEKAPLVIDLRKTELEVGPIKYIAALLSSSPSSEDLERAVRMVIIIIVAIFDPLAIALLLASQYSFLTNIADTAPSNLPPIEKAVAKDRKPRVKKVVTANPKIEEVEKADLSSLNEVPISAIGDMPISENAVISDNPISADEVVSDLDAISRPGDYILR